MSQEFRYPLTRYCLRGGTLTLPRTMLGLFPESGEVIALDTLAETEHTLEVFDQRTITGLGPLFKHHRLAVNDELVIRPLEDGRFSVTAMKREQKPDFSSAEARQGLLDELIAASVPVTPAEVRALYQGIPDDLDLNAMFETDKRFVKREGRWHNALTVAFPPEPVRQPAAAQAEPVASDEESLVAANGPMRTDSQGASHEGDRQANASAAAGFPHGVAGSSGPTQPQASALGSTGGVSRTTAGDPAQAGLWPGAGEAVESGAQANRAASSEARTPEAPAATVFERRQPAPEPSQRPHHAGAGGAAGNDDDQAEADGAEDDGGASLEVTELANRLRAVLAPCGFRLEPVARGQILLTADLGRKSYTALLQLLTRSDRLDWADLLARRRALNVRYLAVIGDHRALLRLSNQAGLARATMWSWQALDRLATLQRTMSFSPIDLESHFERDGLFEKGLERFEAAVATRVAERGVVSELLSRLAVMRSPSVFLLEDLAGELKVPRDRLLKLLEMLSEAPFHLVAKVDHGEFVLRQRVADSLSNVASYATSLSERLPTKQVEKLTGLAEPDLLTGGELDDAQLDSQSHDERPLKA